MPSVSPSPAPPFADWPVHMVFGDGDGLVWYATPGVVCVQILGERCDLALARRYVETIRAVRAVEAREITAQGGLRMYQDCRRLRVVEREARIFLSDAARADFPEGSVVFNKIALPAQTPIVRVAVQLISMAVRRFGTGGFELETDIEREVARARLRPLPHGPRLEALRAEHARRMALVRAA